MRCLTIWASALFLASSLPAVADSERNAWLADDVVFLRGQIAERQARINDMQADIDVMKGQLAVYYLSGNLEPKDVQKKLRMDALEGQVAALRKEVKSLAKELAKIEGKIAKLKTEDRFPPQRTGRDVATTTARTLIRPPSIRPPVRPPSPPPTQTSSSKPAGPSPVTTSGHRH